MVKKVEKKQIPINMDNYREGIRKLQVLSRLSTQQFLGSRAADDPRQQYLTGLESFKNLANVHLEVIFELVMTKLGVSKEDFLQSMEKQLNKQIQAMEQDLCVTSWDDQGNPIFDLKRYAERTKLWPV